ncbi:MAG: hypothetical protein KDD33_07640 [Bdellovibrionales bacterium]|nr:hypothetical protein [Bdellovibrionales bacterium]
MAFRLFSLLLLVLSAGVSWAKDMAPEEVYARCHARLSGFPVDIDSKAYSDVKAGKLDPVTACQQMLTRANFVKTDDQFLLKNEKDSIAVGIVRNLHAFHLSWFPNLAASHNVSVELGFTYRDFTEPALYITDALFTRRHYRTVFTRGDSLTGVRKSAASNGYFMYSNRNYADLKTFSGPLTTDFKDTSDANIQLINFPRVKNGNLVGVEPVRNMVLKLPSFVGRASITEAQWRTSLEDVQSFNLKSNFGGGILGSPAYYHINKEFTGLADGGTKVYRRMANSAFYDLMCLSLPNLKESDLGSYLNTYKSSGLAFRTDKSCAACHATLDPFAHAARNIQTVRTSTNGFRTNLRDRISGAFEMEVALKYKVRTNEQSVADVDNIYHRRRADGRLFYRNYDGKLVNKAVNGVAQLGTAISQQDDIYMCAAQRYYQFLTGIEVAVSSPSSSEFYKTHRDEIVKIGKSFKTHGSLQKLIVDILNTDAFQTRNPGLEVTVSE